MTERRAPAHYAAFAGMSLIWGSTFLAIRLGNETVEAEWGATIRLVIAALLLGAIALIRRTPFPRGAALRSIALFGFLNLGVNFALLYWGERTVPSGIASVFYATMPISTGIFAWAFGLQRLDPIRMLSALVGLGGVALIFAGELTRGAPVLALLAVFAAATCAALSSIVLKRAPPHSPIVTNAIGALVGAVVCLAASFLLKESHTLPRSFAGWGPILYLAVVGNLGAFVLYAWLINRWRVTSVATVSLIVPVIAVTLGAIVRAEAPHPSSYAGAVLVLAGVTISLRAGSR